jgi:hypothetical protein
VLSRFILPQLTTPSTLFPVLFYHSLLSLPPFPFYSTTAYYSLYPLSRFILPQLTTPSTPFPVLFYHSLLLPLPFFPIYSTAAYYSIYPLSPIYSTAAYYSIYPLSRFPQGGKAPAASRLAGLGRGWDITRKVGKGVARNKKSWEGVACNKEGWKGVGVFISLAVLIRLQSCQQRLPSQGS